MWNNNLTESKDGSIMGTEMVPNTEKLFGLETSQARAVFPAGAAIFFLLGMYLLVVSVVYRGGPVSDMEREAMRAKKKHKDLVVDVEELPSLEGDDIEVAWLSSLDELMIVAENLFKPVLHKAERERHIYCVVDAKVRYVYVSELRTGGEVPNMRYLD